jgi:hypothetical protein
MFFPPPEIKSLSLLHDFLSAPTITLGAMVVQSVYCLTTDWTTGVRSPTEAKNFFSILCVQTSSEVHPASYSMGAGGPFPGVKRDRSVTLTTHSHFCRSEEWVGAILPLALDACMAVAVHLYFILLFFLTLSSYFRAQLRNLRQACPKWPAVRFSWHAAFTAVPFFQTTNRGILWIIYEGVNIIYDYQYYQMTCEWINVYTNQKRREVRPTGSLSNRLPKNDVNCFVLSRNNIVTCWVSLVAWPMHLDGISIVT